jgi:membrane protein YqaA with SNARE-associated domain
MESYRQATIANTLGALMDYYASTYGTKSFAQSVVLPMETVAR